jgi:hypothetical protein
MVVHIDIRHSHLMPRTTTDVAPSPPKRTLTTTRSTVKGMLKATKRELLIAFSIYLTKAIVHQMYNFNNIVNTY